MKYTLTQEFRDAVSDEMRQELADALEGSKQHKEALVDDSEDLSAPPADIGMCCLARFEHVLNGTPIRYFKDNGASLGTPTEIPDYVEGYEPLRGDLKSELLENLSVVRSRGGSGVPLSFDSLNDKYMTHAQIRELLLNGEVDV